MIGFQPEVPAENRPHDSPTRPEKCPEPQKQSTRSRKPGLLCLPRGVAPRKPSRKRSSIQGTAASAVFRLLNFRRHEDLFSQHVAPSLLWTHSFPKTAAAVDKLLVWFPAGWASKIASCFLKPQAGLQQGPQPCFCFSGPPSVSLGPLPVPALLSPPRRLLWCCFVIQWGFHYCLPGVSGCTLQGPSCLTCGHWFLSSPAP